MESASSSTKVQGNLRFPLTFTIDFAQPEVPRGLDIVVQRQAQMANSPDQQASLEAQARTIQWFNLGCLALISGPFLLLGIVALLISFAKWADLDGSQRLGALVLGGVFTAVGALPLFASQLNRGWIAAKLLAQKQYPGQPWMWRDDWAKGVIPDNTPSQLWQRWVGAAIVLVGFGVLASHRNDMPAYVYYAEQYPIAVPFVLTAMLALPVWVLGRAAHATLRSRKFGSSAFVLSENPCRLGGLLAGRVETPMQERPQDGAELNLSCLKITQRDSGSRRRSSHVKIVWSSHRAVESHRLGRGPKGITIPVEFEIPADGAPTGRIDVERRHVWRLTTAARLQGVDYRAEFEPPVFRLNAEGQVDDDVPNPM